MSAVRIFDVPHIFRYGCINAADGETWQLFWRNATCFTVYVRRVDVAGTPFEPEWSRHCDEPADMTGHVGRWNAFCDFTIASILPTLQELAPVDGRRWVTLEDYLQTPLYKLRMFKDDVSGNAVARIMEGATVTPAFDMQPQPFSALAVPKELLRIAASDVIVLGHENDLRQPPHKVRISSTGAVCSLVRAGTPVRASETGITTNHSLEAMARILRNHNTTDPAKTLKPIAVVTTTTRHPANSGSESSSSDVRVAGLLHTVTTEDFTGGNQLRDDIWESSGA